MGRKRASSRFKFFVLYTHARGENCNEALFQIAYKLIKVTVIKITLSPCSL